MSNNELTLFDDAFALKQFSDNQPLLIQILEKFVAQYTDFAPTLSSEIEQGNTLAAKQRVHTIKGVSGNLGMQALHLACKNFEAQLNQAVSPHALEAFLQVFDQTLRLIVDYSGQHQPTQGSVPTEANNDKPALLNALKRSEFISEVKLQGFFESIDLPDEIKHKLKLAINDLDYATAIQLLE